MQELINVLQKEYSIKVSNISSFKNGYKLDTNLGKLFLKEVNISKERIQFVNEAKLHLLRNGFEVLDKYIITSNKYPYFTNENNIYTVTEFIDGKECDFDNNSEIIEASLTLAKLHNSGKGFFPSKNLYIPNQLGMLPYHFQKRLNDIKKLKKQAEKEKNDFDYLFLDNYNYFYNLGKRVIDNLNKSNYNLLVEKAKKQGVLCHHDYTYQNIIKKNNRLYVTNYEYCCIELKTYDIVNFLRRKMRKSNWSINDAKLIINNYMKIEELDKDDFELIKLMLQFPQKFWRISNKYYNSKRSWAQKNYITRLQDVIDEKAEIEAFIDEYEKIFLN